jgi:hypothetical protein
MKIMNKKAKIILSSVSSIAICASLIVGSTFALFVTNSAVDAKLTSAKVGVNTSISDLTAYEAVVASDGDSDLLLNEKGEIFEYGVNNDTYKYSEAYKATDNVATFGIKGGTATICETENGVTPLEITNMAPGDKVTFNLSLTNYSTITSKYTFGITTSTVDEDAAFLRRLKITVDGSDFSGIKQYQQAWSGDIAPETKALKTISVTVEYPVWYDTNLDISNCEINFKTQAVQGNMAVSSSPATFKFLDNFTSDSEGITIPEKLEEGATEITIDEDWIKEGATNVVIPAAVNGVPVTKIDYGTFMSNEDIQSVTVPSTVQTIDVNAFESCTNLTSVKLSEGLVEIGDVAFDACQNLTEIVIPSTVTTIGILAFNDTNLTSIFIPSSVTNISMCAFGEKYFATDSNSTFTVYYGGTEEQWNNINVYDSTIGKSETESGNISLSYVFTWRNTGIGAVMSTVKNLTIYFEATNANDTTGKFAKYTGQTVPSEYTNTGISAYLQKNKTEEQI